MTKKPTPFSSTHHLHGFTLLEVLIAIVVLSIGLLGLASLQVNGLRFTQSAYFRTQATQLANDMADRIRANTAGFAGGFYDGSANQFTACNSSAGCSPQQMAEHDTFEWRQTLQASLPAGQGALATNGAGVVTITVRWDNERTGATGLGCNPSSSADLKCLNIMFQP